MAERRPKRRKRVLYAGVIAYPKGEFSLDCTIRDLSENGARLTVSRNTQIPSRFYLINIHDRMAYEAKIVWNIGEHVGVTYEKSHRLADILDPSLTFLKRLWHARAAR